MIKIGSRYFTIIICIIACISILITACAQKPAPVQAPEKIRIGQAESATGPYAPGTEALTTNNFVMWVEETNAAGGLYVPEYKKKIPIEFIKYDDKSDIGEMTKLLEKLILVDKVHFLFPSWGTAMNVAAAPIITKYGYPWITATCTSQKLTEELAKGAFPYMFLMLAQPSDIVPQQLELLKELGAKRLVCTFVEDEHGAEYKSVITKIASQYGIDLILQKTHPLAPKDLTPLIKEMMAVNPDAMIAYSYPDDTFMLCQQSITLGFNPKVFSVGVGGLFPVFRDLILGKDAVQGIMAYAPVSKYSAPSVADFFKRYEKRWNREPETWGGIYTTICCEVLGQAIEKAGLDRAKVRDIIATQTFQTSVGPIRFEKNRNVSFMGLVGQWIDGDMHVIMPKDKRTHAPIYPKPKWPSK